MTRAINISCGVMLAIACMLLTPLAVSAQQFDVKAASALDGNGSEFPFTFTINYDNGESQDVTITGEGTVSHPSPAGVGDISSITANGQERGLQRGGDIICFSAGCGGCWCLCFQWNPIWCWPPWPRLFWYYDPCC